MKTVRRLFLITALMTFAGVMLGACAQGPMQRRGIAQGDGGSVIYWCNCGADCKCNSVRIKPGKCACGKEMAGGHVVFMEGNVALACTCGPECSCKIDLKDHTKCGCGNPVKRLDLAGTGLYFCNCGGSCGCGVVSDKPGTCKCGMQLHQAK